jgi:hypothetical protein
VEQMLAPENLKLAPENLSRALRRVRANRGAPGGTALTKLVMVVVDAQDGVVGFGGSKKLWVTHGSPLKHSDIAA